MIALGAMNWGGVMGARLQDFSFLSIIAEVNRSESCYDGQD